MFGNRSRSLLVSTELERHEKSRSAVLRIPRCRPRRSLGEPNFPDRSQKPTGQSAKFCGYGKTPAEPYRGAARLAEVNQARRRLQTPSGVESTRSRIRAFKSESFGESPFVLQNVGHFGDRENLIQAPFRTDEFPPSELTHRQSGLTGEGRRQIISSV